MKTKLMIALAVAVAMAQTYRLPLQYSGGTVSHSDADGYRHVPKTYGRNPGSCLMTNGASGDAFWGTCPGASGGLDSAHVSALIGDSLSGNLHGWVDSTGHVDSARAAYIADTVRNLNLYAKLAAVHDTSLVLRSLIVAKDSVRAARHADTAMTAPAYLPLAGGRVDGRTYFTVPGEAVVMETNAKMSWRLNGGSDANSYIRAEAIFGMGGIAFRGLHYDPSLGGYNDGYHPIKASRFVVDGGTSAQYQMGDGSLSSGPAFTDSARASHISDSAKRSGYADSSRAAHIADSVQHLNLYARTTAVHDTVDTLRAYTRARIHDSLAVRIPTSLPPSGAAGGDLSSTYPNPTVSKINGVSLAGLATGILKNTTSTGVPGIAAASDFPTLNQNTTGSAAKWTTARTLTIGSTGKALDGTGNVSWSLAEIGAQAAGSYLPLSAGSTNPLTGDLWFTDPSPTGGSSVRGIYGTVSTNDAWRIVGGATASNSGYLEIATADDATEPIYVRQYPGPGTFAGTPRTLTLLDAAGNTVFPGSVMAGGLITGTSFVRAGGLSTQFLKADGSVDSTAYAAAGSLANYLPLSGGSSSTNALTGDLWFTDPAPSGGSGVRGIYGAVGTVDAWRIVGGASATNSGYLEIATADDAQEPIYVRQYTYGTGTSWGSVARSATLLDGSGNTLFPGSTQLASSGIPTDHGTYGLRVGRSVDMGSTHAAALMLAVPSGYPMWALEIDNAGSSVFGVSAAGDIMRSGMTSGGFVRAASETGQLSASALSVGDLPSSIQTTQSISAGRIAIGNGSSGLTSDANLTYANGLLTIAGEGNGILLPAQSAYALSAKIVNDLQGTYYPASLIVTDGTSSATIWRAYASTLNDAKLEFPRPVTFMTSAYGDFQPSYNSGSTTTLPSTSGLPLGYTWRYVNAPAPSAMTISVSNTSTDRIRYFKHNTSYVTNETTLNINGEAVEFVFLGSYSGTNYWWAKGY